MRRGIVGLLVVGVAIGLGVAIGVCFINYHTMARWAVVGYWFSTLLLVAVLIIGPVRGGAKRWIDLKFFQLQPSEIAKLAFILCMAHFLSRPVEELRSVRMFWKALGMVLLTIASCFLFFSFWKRIYGLMLPGAILAGLSLGVTFADVTGGVSVLWGLALGFLAILFLGRALFNQTNPWPVIPAVILFAVGTIVAASNLPGLFVGGLVWMPLLLVGAGLYLGWGRRNA